MKNASKKAPPESWIFALIIPEKIPNRREKTSVSLKIPFFQLMDLISSSISSSDSASLLLNPRMTEIVRDGRSAAITTTRRQNTKIATASTPKSESITNTFPQTIFSLNQLLVVSSVNPFRESLSAILHRVRDYELILFSCQHRGQELPEPCVQRGQAYSQEGLLPG